MANEISKNSSPGNASPAPQQIPLAEISDLPGSTSTRVYTPKELGGLVSSIQSIGVREPIIVRRTEDGRYQLLAGQRRRRASELAKKATIPALVYEMTLQEALDYSFGYVAGWSKGKELRELHAALNTIRKTAAEIIDAVEPPVRERERSPKGFEH